MNEQLLDNPKVGEILKEEFLKEIGMSQNALAKAIAKGDFLRSPTLPLYPPSQGGIKGGSKLHRITFQTSSKKINQLTIRVSI